MWNGKEKLKLINKFLENCYFFLFQIDLNLCLLVHKVRRLGKLDYQGFALQNFQTSQEAVKIENTVALNMDINN